MKRKCPNVYASMWNGHIEYSYGCPDGGCALGLYPVMPPEPDAQCVYHFGGECEYPPAHLLAIVDLRVALKNEADLLIKELVTAEALKDRKPGDAN